MFLGRTEGGAHILSQTLHRLVARFSTALHRAPHAPAGRSPTEKAMSQPIPPRPNPDRKAAKRYAQGQRQARMNTPAVDPNAQFLGEQSAGEGAGWLFLIHRVMRRLIAGR